MVSTAVHSPIWASAIYALAGIVMASLITACDAKPEQAPSDAKAEPLSVESAPPKSTEASTVTKTSPEPALYDTGQTYDVGQKLYEDTCHVCHGQGLLDAPTISHKSAWQSRLAKGKDTLYQHTIDGFNNMPAQADGDISEEDVRAAVDYMIKQVS